MENKKEETFLTEKQVSELTQIPVSTLQLWRSKKTNFPFSKFGKYVRYPKSAIIKALSSTMMEVK